MNIVKVVYTSIETLGESYFPIHIISPPPPPHKSPKAGSFSELTQCEWYCKQIIGSSLTSNMVWISRLIRFISRYFLTDGVFGHRAKQPTWRICLFIILVTSGLKMLTSRRSRDRLTFSQPMKRWRSYIVPAENTVCLCRNCIHTQQTFNQCWFNVGPPSTTLDQR